MKAVALYCRVSTVAQADEDATSLATQEAACRQRAAENGWSVNERYAIREVYTGSELHDRPGLTAIREAIRRGEVGGLICYSIDRLSRNPVHLLLLLDECDHHGATLAFVTESLDSTAIGKLVLHVQGYAAELEREKIRERSLRGKHARVAGGKMHRHGVDLYGYRRDHERGVRVVHDGEATIVRDLFRWVGVEGASLHETVRRLNSADVPSPATTKLTYADGRAPGWTRAQVHRILRNPAYRGETVLWTRRTDGKRQVARAPSDWLYLPDGTTPALVDAATWEAVARRLDTNRGDHTRNQHYPALLRGHLFCARCGRRMSPIRSHGIGYYRCGALCGSHYPPKEWLEEEVWRDVGRLIAAPKLMARARDRRVTPHRALAAERKAAERAIREIERKQDRLLERFSGSTGDDFLWELVERQIAHLQVDRVRHAETVSRIDAATTDHAVTTDAYATLAAWCAQAARSLATFTFDDKRFALSVLGARVTADGREWHLTFGAWDQTA